MNKKILAFSLLYLSHGHGMFLEMGTQVEALASADQDPILSIPGDNNSLLSMPIKDIPYWMNQSPHAAPRKTIMTNTPHTLVDATTLSINKLLQYASLSSDLQCKLWATDLEDVFEITKPQKFLFALKKMTIGDLVKTVSALQEIDLNCDKELLFFLGLDAINAIKAINSQYDPNAQHNILSVSSDIEAQLRDLPYIFKLNMFNNNSHIYIAHRSPVKKIIAQTKESFSDIVNHPQNRALLDRLVEMNKNLITYAASFNAGDKATQFIFSEICSGAIQVSYFAASLTLRKCSLRILHPKLNNSAADQRTINYARQYPADALYLI